MSKAILLSGFHALNWYGYRDSIPVHGNLLLAGVTGSGKSILMDLIQLVLVGDLRLVKFNQSATGAHSDRSLKGYCLGDTKQEEAGVTQYMRSAAITYAALEFTWPGRKPRVETWGFRIEYTSTAENQGRVTPFFIPAALTRADFLDETRCPLDFAAFRALVERHTDAEGTRGRLFATIDEYTREMQQPAHLNFNYKILRGLLPTAMSFTFLRSFNDFCRHFILSAERLEVRDVTESYRAFQRYEKDLHLLQDQLTRLQEIAAHYDAHHAALRDAALAGYLEAELRHQHAATQVQADEARLQAVRAAWAEESTRLAELERLLPEKTAELEAVKNTIRESPEGGLYLELKRQLQRHVGEISRLEEAGRAAQMALAQKTKAAREWQRLLGALPLRLESATTFALERAMGALETEGLAGFSKNYRAVREAAQHAVAEVLRLVEPTQKELARLRHDLGHLRDQIARLKVGKLPIPTKLLDTLNRHLPSVAGGGRPARHLRELCEVKESEERWRPALEVAFTRKLAVVVASEHYDEAERLYQQMTETAGGESLVNPTKAVQMRRPVRAGSLAEKLTSQHPVASAIISQFFGELMCVDDRRELRNHDAAITPDGFMARGAFVERPRHYDNIPYLGERGLGQQLAWKEEQQRAIEAQIAKLAPLAQQVEEVQRAAQAQLGEAHALDELLADARRLPELVAERDRIMAQLNSIDRAKLDELEQTRVALEQTLRELAAEQRRLDQSEKRGELHALEERVQERQAHAQELLGRFQRVQMERDFSAWLPRLNELRTEVCARLPEADAAASECATLANRADRTAVEEWEKLKASRRELGMVHAKFDDLPVEATENEAYTKQLTKLQESEIPDYAVKAERERKMWAQLFRTQVLEKLRHALFEVENTRVLLNNALKRPIGNNRYRVVKRENPDFAIYHRLLDASVLAQEDELFFASANAELRQACDQFLDALIDEDKKTVADRLLDYRQYYDYDMEVDDLGEDGEVKATSRVDKQSGKYSGGENQSPYFIAILASYLRAYKRHETRSKLPSLALVPIDEAFSKLSGERIKDCIEAMTSLELQGVFSMSTGNIPYAFEHCDSLVIVAKEEKRVGKRPEIRNVPVSLHKDSPEARRLLNLE